MLTLGNSAVFWKVVAMSVESLDAMQTEWRVRCPPHARSQSEAICIALISTDCFCHA
jgi:hypothetical protein